MNKNIEALSSIRQVNNPSDGVPYSIDIETVGEFVRLTISSPVNENFPGVQLDFTTKTATDMVTAMSLKIEEALRAKRKNNET